MAVIVQESLSCTLSDQTRHKWTADEEGGPRIVGKGKLFTLQAPEFPLPCSPLRKIFVLPPAQKVIVVKMRVLDNSVVNIELFPGSQNQQPGDAQAQAQDAPKKAQGTAKSAGKATQKAGEDAGKSAQQTGEKVAQSAQDKSAGATGQGQSYGEQASNYAQSTAESAQNTAGSYQQQAKDMASQYQEKAQGYASSAQETAGQYQQGTADYVRDTGDSVHQTGQDYVQGTADGAHGMVKDRLPESTHGYAGQAVDYASNAATGTLGAVGGTVKDVGDTVGNAVSFYDATISWNGKLMRFVGILHCCWLRPDGLQSGIWAGWCLHGTEERGGTVASWDWTSQRKCSEIDLYCDLPAPFHFAIRYVTIKGPCDSTQ